MCSSCKLIFSSFPSGMEIKYDKSSLSSYNQCVLPIQCSGSSGCPCTCNYATDPGCTCRDLKDTLNVTITKGAVYASYPLIYQQAFNYRPTEVRLNAHAVNFFTLCKSNRIPALEKPHACAISAVVPGIVQRIFGNEKARLAQAIIRTGANFPISSCNDGPLSDNPTCGWATDANGARIPASQGFCCSCTSSALAAATLGSGTDQCAHLALQTTICSPPPCSSKHDTGSKGFIMPVI